MTDVFFTGFGLVSSIGDDVGTTFESMGNGISEPGSVEVSLKENRRTIPYRTIESHPISNGVRRMHSIVERAVQQAVEEAGLTEEQLESAGLFFGSTSFDIFQSEQRIKTESLTGNAIYKAMPYYSEFTDLVRDRFSVSGPVYVFNTACTSSANAVMYAAEFIRRGEIDHAIVLGVEFFNEVTALGFSGLDLVSKEGMRPFSTHRDGLYLGEGCGAAILSKQGNGTMLRYAGGANIGDNFSITSSNPDGSVIRDTIERALSDADVSARDVRLVKAHGTASLSNDEAESAGLEAVFNRYSMDIPPITCLKPYIGHTLGACGINELILFARALENGLEPPFRDTEESFHIRYADVADFKEKGCFLLNYFGFGGNSTALVLRND